MAGEVETLDTARGRIALRPERPADEPLLYALFRSTALEDLAHIAVDDTAREDLVRLQFASQTKTYRSEYPQARFDIIEQDGVPIGRLIVDDGPQVYCFVDFVLLPERRASGLGRAIIAALLTQLAPSGKPVQVKVLCTNEPSLRMCKRLGFVQIGAELPYVQLEWRASRSAG